MIVPVRDDGTLPVVSLEPHLLNTPPLALQQTVSAVTAMVRDAWNLVTDSFAVFREKNLETAESLHTRERAIDRAQHDITRYLVQLTERTLAAEQARAVPLLIHCVNDAERIGDHAENLVELAEELITRRTVIPDKPARELNHVFALVGNLADTVMLCLRDGSQDATAEALKIETDINRAVAECRQNDVRRLNKGKYPVTAGIIYVDVLANLERIADHLNNIAERAPEFHGYLSAS
jgi:phosphate:Na+ symporter